MINQVRVSHGLRRFKPGIMKRWNLQDYHDKNASCLFLNINGKEDIDAVKDHQGFKLILFANARGNEFINHFVGVPDLVVMNNPYLDVPEGMMSRGPKWDFTPFEIKDYSMFKPNKLGDKIYAYVGNDRAKDRFGYNILKNLQKTIKTGILLGFQGHTIEDLKRNYYDKCFLNINLSRSGGGGLTTVREMSLMGRNTIMNTKVGYKTIIPYKDNADIIRLINKEAEKIGTVQPGYDYHTIGKEWQDEKYWMG